MYAETFVLCGVEVTRFIIGTHFTTFVTVHAKTSLVRTKIEINILSPAYSYTH